MKSIKRVLDIKLAPKQSAFLWGARKTGKATYLKEKFPKAIVHDFLKTDMFLEVSKRPSLLREWLLAKSEAALKEPIILDEVQKVPQVLDEVHWLVENKGLRFILCGSSARKLKRGHANLLGGRAWRYELFPFVSAELEKINLLRVLNHGMIPPHYLQSEEDCKKSLEAYIQDYLKEEVFVEGLNYKSYAKKDFPVNFWRTKSGLEVDFVLGNGKVAIEANGGRINKKDLSGLDAFINEYSPQKSIVICNEREKRLYGKIQILPWEIFLQELWEGKIL